MGKVIDSETKEPIEGAVVFMRCYTMTGNPGGATSHFADAKEVLTDAKGEFNLELRATTFKLGHLWDYDPNILIFKPGYGISAELDIQMKYPAYYFPTNTYVTITLPKLNSREERDRNLDHLPAPQGTIPFEKWKNFFRLKNDEYIQLGYKPRSIPLK